MLRRLRVRGVVARAVPQLKYFILHESTFFRLHLTAFILVPLVASAIFWGCNGRFTVPFLDSMFLCYSAMTVTGLSTVNLSTLTAWQQVILFLLMLIGHPSFVSWIMVLVRKEYFRRECEWIYRKEKAENDHKALLASISSPRNFFRAREPVPMNTHDIDLEKSARPAVTGSPGAIHSIRPLPADNVESSNAERRDTNGLVAKPDIRIKPVDGMEFVRVPTMMRSPSQSNSVKRVRGGVPLPDRNAAILTSRGQTSPSDDDKGIFGGFPGPLQLLRKVLRAFAPNIYQKMERTITIPYATTIQGRNVPWLTNTTTITAGRNSHFYTEHLTDDQIEEIGGVEYAALRWLVWMVPMYIVGTQLASFLLFGPWLSVTHQYDSVFTSQFREVKKPWFALFQVTAAYTGGGLSLVDLGMLPFQTAYLMSISLMFAILAGNHALPILLRFIIWVLSKIAPRSSDAHSAFDFLLHHPRRCYIYLFPSHQTWFLVLCLVLLSATEWIFFEILDVGLPFFEALSPGTRIICGIFQGLSARAAGFPIVPMSSLAPAVQFMYIIMMYIAVYPVALSIRSTNVYEERSLGIFEAPPESKDDEPANLKDYGPRERIGRYIGWHLRRQLSIDIWWLVWGVFLIAIIERRNIMDESLKWFDMFHVIFELVSAFGTIGLSLGIPTDNFSFSGALHPLSKLVVILIMVRGRHRGLPVRVDRAIMLPRELVKRDQSPAGLHPEPEHRQQLPQDLSLSDQEERTDSYAE